MKLVSNLASWTGVDGPLPLWSCPTDAEDKSPLCRKITINYTVIQIIYWESKDSLLWKTDHMIRSLMDGAFWKTLVSSNSYERCYPWQKRPCACKDLSEEERNLLASCSDDWQLRSIPNYVNSQTREMPEMIATSVGLSSQIEFSKALKSQWILDEHPCA